MKVVVRPSIRDTLSANQRELYAIGQANYFKAYSLTGLVLVELVRANEIVEVHEVERFEVYPDRNFDAMWVTDLTGASNAIHITYGLGKVYASQDRSLVTVDSSTPVDVLIDDDTPVRVDLTSGSVTLNQSNIGNGADDLADLALVADTPAQAIVGSADNMLVILTNPIDSGYPVRVACHANVDGSTGTVLQPGDTWERFTQADVYAMAVGGAVNLQRELDTRT